jgi:hypothetical protein
VTILRTEHDVIVDIVDAVVCSSIHDPIILYVHVFEKTNRLSDDAPFILQDKPVGFQGQRSIKLMFCGSGAVINRYR